MRVGTNMIKITLVIPYKGFLEDSKEIFEAHNQFGQFYGLESNFSFQLELTEISQSELKNFKSESDVIISRGFNAQILKENIKGIPIVDIPVSGNDLIMAIYKAIEQYDTKNIAVIGAKNMIYGVEGLANIFNINLKSFIMNNIEYSEGLVAKAIDEGYDTIIGGYKACQFALSQGLNSLLIKTSRDSFWQALTEAKRLAILYREEAEITLGYKTMIESINEGIISIDNDMHVIMINDSAKSFLNLSENNQLLGENINDVTAMKALVDLFKQEKDITQHVIQLARKYFLINTKTLYLRDNKIGKLMNLQEAGNIRDQEYSLRRKIYSKGHIAKYTFDDIIHESKEMNDMITIAKKYSLTHASLLIQGESGTGKEMIAQSIHNYSNRHNEPFVAINCANLNESLLDSTLFGYVAGAFTGASTKGKAGLFELANKGTIFLDEIGDMPLNLQGKLLRVLQEKEVMRIGDEKVTQIDVRVIAATHRDLNELIRESLFRSDLFYRLNILNIQIPPLCNRPKDIPLLVHKFIDDISFEYDKSMTISEGAIKLLSQLSWKGNIRELRSVCERLVIVCEHKIKKEDIDKLTSDAIEEQNTQLSSVDKRQEIYREKVMSILVKNNFNKTKTAKELGISRTTLWRHLNETD